jgi:hypothetical protein
MPHSSFQLWKRVKERHVWDGSLEVGRRGDVTVEGIFSQPKLRNALLRVPFWELI